MIKPSEAIKLIKQCGDSGVKTLSYQGLEVEFKVGQHSIVQQDFNFDGFSQPLPDVSYNPYSHPSLPEDLGSIDLEDPFAAENLMENGFDSDDSFQSTTSA